MSKLEKPKFTDKQQRIIQLLNEITNYTDISILDVTLYIECEESQHSSINKCAQGKRFPNFLNTKIDKVLKKLEDGAKDPDLIRKFKQSMPEDGNKVPYKKASKSILVWIPFDLNMPVADFNLIKPHLSFHQIGEKKGLIVYRNTSQHEADGEVYSDNIGTHTYIEPGTRIAIKRIDKTYWLPNIYYLIIDEIGQKSILELLPGEDDKTVRCVSTISPEGPHKVLSLEAIVAMFTIIDANYTPKPKRNK
jgi:hypothetical protein